jgi:hypothetical protein
VLVPLHSRRVRPARHFLEQHGRWLLDDPLRLNVYTHRVCHCWLDQNRALDEALSLLQ